MLAVGLPGYERSVVVGVRDLVMDEKTCSCVTTLDGRTLALAGIVRCLRNEKHGRVHNLLEYLLLMPVSPRSPVGKVPETELRAQAKARHAPTEGDTA